MEWSDAGLLGGTVERGPPERTCSTSRSEWNTMVPEDALPASRSLGSGSNYKGNSIRLAVLNQDEPSEDEPPSNGTVVTVLDPPLPTRPKHANGKHTAAVAGVPLRAPAAPAPDEFIIGPGAADVRARAFPDATDAEWNDWKWQLRHRVKDGEGLARILNLTDDERATVEQLGGQLPIGITPYYAGTLDPDNPLQGLRKTMVPTSGEFVHTR